MNLKRKLKYYLTTYKLIDFMPYTFAIVLSSIYDNSSSQIYNAYRDIDSEYDQKRFNFKLYILSMAKKNIPDNQNNLNSENYNYINNEYNSRTKGVLIDRTEEENNKIIL